MPWASGPTPKISASVWPRSANVWRVPRSTPGAHARAGDEQRHVLARVIGARRRRIVAVVGGDDQQIVVAKRRQQRGQPRVEALEIRGVAGDVVAMAVLRVEVDEVGEDQPAIERRAICALDLVHAVIVADGVDGRA